MRQRLQVIHRAIGGVLFTAALLPILRVVQLGLTYWDDWQSEAIRIRCYIAMTILPPIVLLGGWMSFGTRFLKWAVPITLLLVATVVFSFGRVDLG